MSLDIETKSLATGYETALILGGRDCFVRETNLPNNWTRVRIALIGSLTSLTSSNGTPSTEIIQGSNVAPGFLFAIGLSDGIGVYGQSGSLAKFVGITNGLSGGSSSPQIIASSSLWGFGHTDVSTLDSINFNAAYSTGSVVQSTAASSAVLYSNTGDPTATSSFCFYWGIDLFVSGSGTFTTLGAQGSSKSSTSDASLMGIFSLTYSPIGNPTPAGGWWAGNNPVNCTYLYIRWPFINNRLRIHNLGVMQLS